MKARFTKHARSELLGQTAYYGAIEKGLGARFRSEVEKINRTLDIGNREAVGNARQRLKVLRAED